MTAPTHRVQRRPVHGVLLLDKPLKLSSNDALQKAKWLLRAEKAGHTGTLDPLATGVLPLCFGAATKFSALQLEAVKTYEATAKLGVKTATADAEGAVILTRPVNVLQTAVEAACYAFTGVIRQTPPMSSALKKDGKPLYAYARAGIEVERETRQLMVSKLKIWRNSEALDDDELFIRVTCSKGTYVRTLAEDIGEQLGCGAHLTALRRTATGQFTSAQCVRLEDLEAMSETQRMACLLPLDSLLQSHTRIDLDVAHTARFLTGLRRRGTWPDCAQVAVYGPDDVLLGAAHVVAGELIPTRLLSPIDIEQIQTQHLQQHAAPLTLD